MKPNKMIAIPTNIITGFLGAGKTSAILQLLADKPPKERWAVLVNEFGEIGVDGSLLDGQYSTLQNVFIREVPGGCMCCTAGVPMQVALNKLLREAKPDRLLIEPTGLGHPKEVLKVLSASHYQDVLSLQKTLTLVDARQLNDPRYTTHDIFNQQINIADIVIGNKTDLYQNEDKINLTNYVKTHGQANATVLFSQHGDIDISLLAGRNSAVEAPSCSNHKHHHNDPIQKLLVSDLPIPECGFIKAVNTGEGYHSVGWRFSIDTLFNHHKLLAFLNTISAERIKGVFNTDIGTFGYNINNDNLTETQLNGVKESRIEIILQSESDLLEAQLMACIND